MKKVYCIKCKWIHVTSTFDFYCHNPKNLEHIKKESPIHGLMEMKIFKTIKCEDKNVKFDCPDFKLSWWRKFTK